MGGFNFVRPERVIAIQTSANGSTVIVMEGGTLVNSTEQTRVLAARFAGTAATKSAAEVASAA